MDMPFWRAGECSLHAYRAVVKAAPWRDGGKSLQVKAVSFAGLLPFSKEIHWFQANSARVGFWGKCIGICS